MREYTWKNVQKIHSKQVGLKLEVYKYLRVSLHGEDAGEDAKLI